MIIEARNLCTEFVRLVQSVVIVFVLLVFGNKSERVEHCKIFAFFEYPNQLVALYNGSFSSFVC